MDDLEDRGLVGPDVPGQGREISDGLVIISRCAKSLLAKIYFQTNGI